MTPPVTLLMKSPLHPDGPHISGHQSPVLFWVWLLGGAGGVRPGEAGGTWALPCWGRRGRQVWAPSFPQPTLGNEPHFIFNETLKKIEKLKGGFCCCFLFGFWVLLLVLFLDFLGNC